MTIQVDVGDLMMLGDEVVRRTCGHGRRCCNSNGRGCVGRLPVDETHLLSYLRGKGWNGAYRVDRRPLYVLEVSTGVRQYIQLVLSTGSFRLLGIQLSPSLNWANAVAVLHQKMAKLQNMLDGAVRRRAWRHRDIITAENGKVMG